MVEESGLLQIGSSIRILKQGNITTSAKEQETQALIPLVKL